VLRFGLVVVAADESVLLPLLIVEPLLVELLLASVLGELALGAAVALGAGVLLDVLSVVLLLGLGLVLCELGAAPVPEVDGLLV
jgi:hypothetical protein